MELCLHSPYMVSCHGQGQLYFYKFEIKNSSPSVVKFSNKNVYEEPFGGCRSAIRVGSDGKGEDIGRSQGLETLSNSAEFMTHETSQSLVSLTKSSLCALSSKRGKSSCTMGTGSFPGVKRPGRGADHPPH